MIAEYRFHASTPRNGNFSHLVITLGRYRCSEIGTNRPLLTYFKRMREKDSILAWAISGGEIDQISCWRYKNRRSCNHLPRMKQPIVLKMRKGVGLTGAAASLPSAFLFLWVRPIFAGKPPK